MGLFGGGGGASASNMVGATASVAGSAGLCPAPAAGDQGRLLRGDGTFVATTDQAFPTSFTRRSGYIAFVGCSSSGQGARDTQTGYVLCPYIYIPQTKSYTTYSIYVSGAGAANSLGKLAIYTIGAGGIPSNLICESGTLPTSSTGLMQPTMNSIVISCGWYFCLIATNSSTNVLFYGDAMTMARGFVHGTINAQPIGLDYSQKAYANLWPNPWDGTGNTFQNNYHPVVELT